MKRQILLCAYVFLAALISGCTTLADARAGKGTGISKVYDKPYDVVWNATMESMVAAGLQPSVADKEGGIILAKGNISAFSWGENVAIFVEKVKGDSQTRVEVVNKAAFSPNVTAKEWAPRIFNHLEARL